MTGGGIRCAACGHVKRPKRQPYAPSVWRHADGSPVSRVGPVSIFAPFTEGAIRAGELARATITEWDARRVRGEYPVLVAPDRVEWRAA